MHEQNWKFDNKIATIKIKKQAIKKPRPEILQLEKILELKYTTELKNSIESFKVN